MVNIKLVPGRRWEETVKRKTEPSLEVMGDKFALSVYRRGHILYFSLDGRGLDGVNTYNPYDIPYISVQMAKGELIAMRDGINQLLEEL